MDERLILEYIERGVRAIERLADDPVIQMETAPPVCPHCERINPTVRVDESEATGAMGEIVYKFHCLHCNSAFLGIPVQWECTKSVEEAARLINERAELNGLDRREN